MSIVHVVSVSGGKDSEATMLIAIERFGAHRCRFVFADTGNEDDAVYEHLAYLEQALGVEIIRLKSNFDQQIANKRMFIARDKRIGRKNGKKLRWTNKAKRRALAALYPTGNPYLDLCIWKGRFPSRKTQFCTEQLKTIPLVEYQLSLIEQGYTVVSWQGVRRDESHARKDVLKFEVVGGGLFIYRPIVDWTAQQTIDYCLSRGVSLNPLYSEGFDRVGCMLCINAGKEEIANSADRKPHHIDRLAQWELVVRQASKRGESTFFPNSKRDAFAKPDIHAVVRWAKTAHGGRQTTFQFERPVCASSYGLCG